MTILTKFTLNLWRQFSKIDIDFHKNLTILTGANGTGKTTLLDVMGCGFVPERQFLATRLVDEQGRFYYNVLEKEASFTLPILQNHAHPAPAKLGDIIYSNGNKSEIAIRIQNTNVPSYGLYYYQQYKHKGAKISCNNRGIAHYQTLTSINADTSINGALNRFSNLKNQQGNPSFGQVNPFFEMKSTLISFAANSYNTPVIKADENARRVFLGFQEVLRNLLPPSLKFKGLSVRMPELVIETETGDFLIDSASSGLLSLIEIAWLIHIYSFNEEEFIMLIDEPENHLHPAMQRIIMPNLIKAFPKVQFVVATHSPFVVSSVRDCSVYALRYDEKNKVYSHKLDPSQYDGTSDEVLQEALGVPSSIPVWVEEKLKTIVEKFSASTMTPEDVVKMKLELEGTNLAPYFSQSLELIKE